MSGQNESGQRDSEHRESGAASTPKGERRRQQLIEAASALLVEGGFSAVRHRAVAERAGLPLASTTYYFDSLDDLITAAVEHQSRTELDRSERQWRDVPEEERTVEATVQVLLDHLLGHRQPSVEADYEAVLSRYERLVATGRRQFLRPLMREMGEQMDALLLDVLSRCGYATDRAAVARLVALVDGTVVNALIQVDPNPRDAAAQALLAELRA
ncbi:TetR/AcrR family transcriptional regulator [Sciscionella sediminilitoris]|uniref:TetR/AcrR family transcriptional regulator n=1 Tax=Sciscionella sediminilitoris TaxID=1445613 RepID=UPI0004DED2C7|nr:TetR family transcriptional regulator [Sciscionella sp. SE31]